MKCWILQSGQNHKNSDWIEPNSVSQVWFDSIPHQQQEEKEGGIGVAILVTCGQYPILDLDPILLSSDNPPSITQPSQPTRDEAKKCDRNPILGPKAPLLYSNSKTRDSDFLKRAFKGFPLKTLVSMQTLKWWWLTPVRRKSLNASLPLAFEAPIRNGAGSGLLLKLLVKKNFLWTLNNLLSGGDTSTRSISQHTEVRWSF